MRTIIIAVFILFTIFAGTVAAGGYKITKVIEVGPGHPPMTGTIKWSPDGTKLAYFNDGALYLSDSLGVSQQVAVLGLAPHSFEWLSNQEVVLDLTIIGPWITYLHRLEILDILTGQTTVLSENAWGDQYPPGSDSTWYIGPQLSTEGELYYTHISGGRFAGPGRIVFPKSAYAVDTANAKFPKGKVLAWRTDGLYATSADRSDSGRIAPSPGSPKFAAVLSPDHSRYVCGGVLYTFADSSYLHLEDYVKDYPPDKRHCGFLDWSFNPKGPEVLFTLIYSDGDYDELRAATFDYSANELTVIDPMIGMIGCEGPVCSADGKKIGLYYNKGIFIIYREFEE